jgi:TetR/AcrR family transcriptional regulator, transcriptional repressor for nem operon
MPKDGSITRNRIMDEAQTLIIQQGYAATSIESIIANAEITKGSFFYHFKGKGDLALQLVKRFADVDKKLLADTLGRAEKLSQDPLQQLLIMMGLYEEMFEGFSEETPGCLFASYVYESNLMSDEIRAIIVDAVRSTTERIAAKLEEAKSIHPPRIAFDARSVADLFTTSFEGAFVMARTLPEKDTMLDQLRHYRTHLRLLFGVEDTM